MSNDLISNKEEVLTPRRLNMLPTFQRFFNMPLTDPFIELSREEYKDLLGLITALEEENKRLFDYAQRVYSAVNSDYTTDDKKKRINNAQS